MSSSGERFLQETQFFDNPPLIQETSTSAGSTCRKCGEVTLWDTVRACRTEECPQLQAIDGE